MKKRKLNFLISMIAMPYVLLVLLSLALFAFSFFASTKYSGIGHDHSSYLAEDLEINIDLWGGDEVSASLSQPSYTLLYTIPADQENGCPEYEAESDIWSEQGRENITVDPDDEIICYLATEYFVTFLAYEYEIGSDSEQEVEDVFAAISITLILIIITYAFILIPFIYMIYWLVQTKAELQARGADEIPSSWLIIVPVANIYYIYKYAEGAEKVTKGKVSPILILIVFLLTFPLIVMPICQSQYNKTD